MQFKLVVVSNRNQSKWVMINSLWLVINTKALADLGGGARDACPPPLGQNSFIFMQFSLKNLPKIRLAPPPWKLAPPCLGNPGSATD